jgi:hypothetical protein
MQTLSGLEQCSLTLPQMRLVPHPCAVSWRKDGIHHYSLAALSSASRLLAVHKDRAPTTYGRIKGGVPASLNRAIVVATASLPSFGCVATNALIFSQ